VECNKSYRALAMQLPYRLSRRSKSEPATALLLDGDTGRLLSLCAQLGHDPLPDVFATRDGFLLLLEAPTTKLWPHTLRLRRLAEFLPLPVDADLTPQLHNDEAASLTRDRGLIFLPGGRVLEFAPDAPLGLEALLQVGDVSRGGWAPLPAVRR